MDALTAPAFVRLEVASSDASGGSSLGDYEEKTFVNSRVKGPRKVGNTD